ncbi:MAG: hypothetical protein LC778_05570 [Acidobacteria bacterium]|nr:hypothetical protein [Acidobacteriota bacterium]
MNPKQRTPAKTPGDESKVLAKSPKKITPKISVKASKVEKSKVKEIVSTKKIKPTLKVAKQIVSAKRNVVEKEPTVPVKKTKQKTQKIALTDVVKKAKAENKNIKSVISTKSIKAIEKKPKVTIAAKTKLEKTKPTQQAKNLKFVGRKVEKEIDEKTEFEKAVNQISATERIAGLQKFVKNFPKSNEKTRALELVVSARAEIADEKLRLSDTASGVELFKLAVKNAPKPLSDKLFTEIVLQIPTNLFLRGQQAAALEVAKLIEEKTEGNAKQILGLATFYLGTENASEAKRLAEKALQLEPNSPAAYQTLGIAYRLNFQLEEAANAYAKALEFDENSIVSKRSLAEMKRATGKTDEAVALYREILAKNSSDAAAQSGLVLSLFDAEKRAEAETEMQKSLEQTPNNLSLLVGAAYWYAAHGQGAKAIELAEKAVAVEPRYTWAHIALARGLMQEKRPLEAERALLIARQYGNFPTLDYEIAAARFQAGFFQEASNELKKTFAFKDGTIETRLGGRVPVQAKNFIDLLALERRASIFEPTAADNSESADKLKSLFDFAQKLDAPETNEITISEEKRTALPKILELTKSAGSQIDSSLEVATPVAAVLADELYESRTLAMTRGELVIVPNVSRQTLSGILRGRIEDITGWALFQQDKPNEAVIRLKRAVSVLPEKSAWWRGSMWRLGAALDADGKSKEALDAYIKSYASNSPDAAKHIIIETLYQKIYGSSEGLEQKIGATPASTNANFIRQTEKSETSAQTKEKGNVPNETSPVSEIKSPVASENPPTVKEISPTVSETKPTPEISTAQNTETEKKIEITTNQSSETTAAPEVSPIVKTDSESKQTEVVKNQMPEPNSTKPLFEPIIITVPKAESAKNSSGEEKPTGENLASRNKRPRVVTENKNNEKTGAPIEKTSQCKITTSQENISIISGGGSLGVLVGFEDKDNLEEITAASSSPEDVEVVGEPEKGVNAMRSFFVIKSMNQRKGEFSVTFEAPCGKKVIFVSVR